MRTTLIQVASALLLVGMSAGCTEKTRDTLGGAKLSDVRSTTRPNPQHALDVRFENKVRLLGYDLSVETAVPDRPFTVTWYWQVDDALGEGWDIFTHVGDQRRQNRLNLDATRILRRLHPIARWKRGEFIKDAQEVTLPQNWGEGPAVFYLGFYNGPHRLHVSRGKHDSEHRAEVLRMPVGSGQQEKPLPRLIARRATGAITLDGKLVEADWQAAQPTGPFVNTMTGETGGFQARAHVVYDEEQLYVAFVVEDDHLKSTFQNTDDHLWEQDTVEVMLDPDGDGQNYFEIQVSPRGVSFDTRYDSPRQPRPFGHVQWSSRVRAGVSVDGTLDDDGAGDRGYTVELALPYAAFATGATPVTPPARGESWRINFFVMDARSQGQRAVGWSAPLVGDFHTLSRFGRVFFPEAASASAAAPEASAPGKLATP